MPKFPVLLMTLAFATFAHAEQRTWQPPPGQLTPPLWPHEPPGAKSNPTPEYASPADYLVAGRQILLVHNVSIPTLTVYQPKSNPSGAGILVFPGGGYNILAIDHEGTEVCDWLVSINVACIMVKYRVPETGPFPKSPAALQDAQRAIGLVRQHASEWHINLRRIGVLGFSAGAHLAAAVSTHYDRRVYDSIDDADQQSCRPDFVALIYPGYLAFEEKNYAPNSDVPVTPQTPPTFLVMAEDDPVHVENATVYFQLLKNAKVPAELHIYTEGGHGYGLRPTQLPVTLWPKLVETWLHTIHILSDSTR